MKKFFKRERFILTRSVFYFILLFILIIVWECWRFLWKRVDFFFVVCVRNTVMAVFVLIGVKFLVFFGGVLLFCIVWGLRWVFWWFIFYFSFVLWVFFVILILLRGGYGLGCWFFSLWGCSKVYCYLVLVFFYYK